MSLEVIDLRTGATTGPSAATPAPESIVQLMLRFINIFCFLFFVHLTEQGTFENL